MTKEQINKLIEALVVMRDMATDEQALVVSALYPAWKVGVAYGVDARVQYGEKLYRCVQAHTSQADWTPDSTPALWVVISIEEWPEFVKPIGAHDAYNTGDKVTFEGEHYVCAMDGCVYSPVEYPAGWAKQ